MIRDKYWQCIGNLKMSDRRLLATFLFNVGLFPNVKKAGEFADECAAGLDRVPLISRITDAIKALGHTFRLNLLEDTIEVDSRRMDDIFMARLYLLMEDKKFKQMHVDNAVAVLAKENEYHPVRDYLLALEWDGTRRLPLILQYFHGDGAMATYPDGTQIPLHGLLIKRWLLGCVARALDGGKAEAFKHQTPMLVIIGKQGLGKSSFVRWLVSGVGYEFHQEGPIDPHSIEDKRSMVTKWIWEVSELGASLRKSDRDALKGIITQEWHTYRKPWGRYNITKPTLCNFVGTINPETGFLDDPTGHRRFLPIQLTAIERGYESAIEVDQLWAEIVALYLGGESPELTQIERDALVQVYEKHEVENPLQTYIAMYFDVLPGNVKMRCTTAEIISRLRSFGININNEPRVSGRILNDTLAPMGLISDRWKINGIKVSGWCGIEPNGKTPLSNGF
jgi:predicted P-loop ATPase